MMDWLNIVGAIASVLGAVIAIAAACKAVRARSAVEAIRINLGNTQQLASFEELASLVGIALAVTSKYGPAATPAQLEGASYIADAEQVQKLYEALKRGPEMNALDPNWAHVSSRLPGHITAFSRSKRKDEAMSAGREVYDDVVFVRRVIEIERTRLRNALTLGAE